MQKQDGPALHRILRPKLKQNYYAENGWCNSDYVEFDMGKNYISDYKQLLRNDEGEDLHNHIQKTEEKLKTNFKAKMQTLQQFLVEMNNKYNYSSQPADQLKQSLMVLDEKNSNIRNNPVKYMKYKGQRYFELVPEFLRQNESKSEPNLLKTLNTFKPTIEIPLSQITLKEKFLDDLFEHLRKKPRKKERDQTSNLFKRLEDQSKLVLQLANSNGVSDAFGQQGGSKKENQLKLVNEITNNQGKQKMMLAEDFNKSQYIFSKNDEDSSAQSPVSFQSKRRTINLEKNMLQGLSPSRSPSPVGRVSFFASPETLQQKFHSITTHNNQNSSLKEVKLFMSLNERLNYLLSQDKMRKSLLIIYLNNYSSQKCSVQSNKTSIK